ncbi:MAG: hypothetical protein BWY17_01405 [Deltaproteobacteria bacterium ADurb.Bin207]|jgi:hypothetical protein|nr:MAG: hypothetical protein BWY17_01405 [Deltaproteobacteria bacterium ADurb.Bin207]
MTTPTSQLIDIKRFFGESVDGKPKKSSRSKGPDNHVKHRYGWKVGGSRTTDRVESKQDVFAPPNAHDSE